MIPVWCEFVCEQCADTWGTLVDRPRIPRGRMYIRARRVGWHFWKMKAFCSQGCLTAYKARSSPLVGEFKLPARQEGST